jgi:hypothetical protein
MNRSDVDREALHDWLNERHDSEPAEPYFEMDTGTRIALEACEQRRRDAARKTA